MPLYRLNQDKGDCGHYHGSELTDCQTVCVAPCLVFMVCLSIHSYIVRSVSCEARWSLKLENSLYIDYRKRHPSLHQISDVTPLIPWRVRKFAFQYPAVWLHAQRVTINIQSYNGIKTSTPLRHMSHTDRCFRVSNGLTPPAKSIEIERYRINFQRTFVRRFSLVAVVTAFLIVCCLLKIKSIHHEVHRLASCNSFGCCRLCPGTHHRAI